MFINSQRTEGLERCKKFANCPFYGLCFCCLGPQHNENFDFDAPDEAIKQQRAIEPRRAIEDIENNLALCRTLFNFRSIIGFADSTAAASRFFPSFRMEMQICFSLCCLLSMYAAKYAVVGALGWWLAE